MAKKTSKKKSLNSKAKLAAKKKSSSKKKPTPKKQPAKKKATTPRKKATIKAVSAMKSDGPELPQEPHLGEAIADVGCCVINYFGTTFYEQTTRGECERKPQNYPGSTVVFQPDQPCPINARPASEMDDIDNFD